MNRALFLLFSFIPGFAVAQLSYETDIKPIFREHCLKCHGDDEQKADLNLQSFDSALKGGSGGKALVAGRPSQSPLYEAITNPEDEDRMPPKKPPIPAEQTEKIRLWIQEGLRQSAGGKALVAERDLGFSPDNHAGQKPEGPPPMPEHLPAVKVPETARPLPVLAMDTSPRAPLLAVSGEEHIRLIHTETRELLGILPFPEGVPQVIRFSRDGSVLTVAGGRPVQSGKVVLYEVRTGKRLAEIGDEVDAVLAADLSPDQKQVALGGSGKVVKVYSTEDGKLLYKISKHTDWITAAGFSPDGSKLATADRAGGVHLWDARSGGILLTLSEHKAAVRSLAWRADSRLLATGGEDGLLIWWDVTDGWPAISHNNAHPPQRPPGFYGKLANGVLAVGFGPDGTLLTAGRDRVVRLWDQAGKQVATHEIANALPTGTRITHDGKTLVGGDSTGRVSYWPVTAK